MSGLSGLLDTARSALLTHQRALQLTGNNIANVNTEGYSRQRLDLGTRGGQRLGGMGAGVEPIAVRRLRMESFDRSFRAEQSGLGNAETRDLQLAGLESVIAEPGGSGLGAALDQFWSAWSDLSNEPGEDSYRRTVVEAGHQLAQRFQYLNGQLRAMRQDINLDVVRVGEEITSSAAEIASLNDAIAQAELGGQPAADLRDRRDTLVDELALKADIQFGEDAQGTYRVWLSGRAIVDGVHHAALQTSYSQASDGTVIAGLQWADNRRPLAVSSGELAGLLDVRDRVLPARLGDLDAMADALAGEVNRLHREGFDLAGNAGGDFFTQAGKGAAGIELRAVLMEDPSRLAASLDGGAGNGDTAARIADLAEAELAALSGNSLSEAWSLLVARVGTERRQAENELGAQQAFVAGLDERRLAVSGVNLDEELTIMMAQEQAYAAAARVVSVADEMIATILGLVS